MQPLEPRHALAATADPRLAVFLAPPVDKTPPVIVSVTPPVDKTYAAGAVLSFTVGFSENVRVTGSPALPIDIGGSVRNAFWDGKGSNSKFLTFTTKVLGGDSDTNGLSTKAALVLSGGSIRDPAGNAANLALPAKFQSFPRVLVDGVGPAVRSFSAITADTWQKKLTVTAVFGEAVTVTGNPTIPFTLAGKARQLVYGGGSGSSRLTFTYAPGNGESLSSAAVLPQAPVITLPARAFLADRVGNRAVSLGGPVAVALSGAIVAGNQPAGTVVGTLSAVDPDGARDPATFTLVSGPGSADNAFFAIDGTKLVTRARLDNESRSSLTARVRARDAGGLWVERAFAVAIASGNDAPTAVALVDRLDALVETASTASRMKVANIAVTDDGLGTNVLTLAGPDAASFEIVGTTLCLKAGVRLDAATKPSYAVSVSVADPSLPGGTPPTADFRLAVMPSSGVFAGFGYAATRDGVTITRYSGAATDVVIPARIHGLPVSAIGFGAFLGRADLASVTLPAGVTRIGAFAFWSCRGLKSVTIPAGVTSIGDNAFGYCTSLASVTIPASVTGIDNYAFYYCTSLTSVTIPAGVTSIGDNAFGYCTSLTSVTIPAGVTSIGGSAFVGCTSLTSVTIPASVTTIGTNPFAVCSALTNIGVDAENPTYASVGGVLYDKATASLVAVPSGLSGSLTIPAGITKIGASAFARCVGLTNVTIPASVTTIGDAAFRDCSGLTSVTIPARVTTIGDSTFLGCMSLTSVNLPAGVTSIGDIAFAGCKSLTSVTIPTSVTKIGDYVFGYCKSLTSVTIPASVASIGRGAFHACNSLASVVFQGDPPALGGPLAGEGDIVATVAVYPAGNAAWTDLGASFRGLQLVPSVGTFAGFSYSTAGGGATITGYSGAATDVVIPANIYGLPVSAIGDIAFSDRGDLTSVTLPAGIRSIGSNAFARCVGLTSVTIPAGVTTIGVAAFGDCVGLTSVTIPAGVTTISDSTFSGCMSLTSVSLPAGITSIGNHAFLNCRSLTSVTIPTNVTRIGNLAFQLCMSLTSMTIPASVTSIGQNPFIGCDKLTSIEVDVANAHYASIDGLLYDKPIASLLAVRAGLSGSLTIPAGVTSIGDYAFCWSDSLTSVTIPEGVTRIGSSAFSGCISLQSVTIPASVTSIGSHAFGSCTGLTNVTIPAGVTTIGDYALYSCGGLTSVTIPASVTSIGRGAFHACNSLASVVFQGDPPALGGPLAGEGDIVATVAVYPAGNAAWTDLGASFRGLQLVPSVGSFAGFSYSAAGGGATITGYSGAATDVVIPANIYGLPVSAIGDIAFSDRGDLTSVTLPAGIRSIGSNAFARCVGLTSVTIPAGVTTIGDAAFGGCTGLTSVTIPAGVTSIGRLVFYSCAGLTSVTIPVGVTSIGSYAFAMCTSLTNVTIPAGVTSIGDYAFDSCTSLTSVTIPAGVTSIGDYAFSRCTSLTSLMISAGVTSIGRHAFSGCWSLTSVAIPATVTGIGEFAFWGCSGMTSVTIPAGVTSIGSQAFSGCQGLTSVAIPASVTSIGTNPFAGCVGLRSIGVDTENPRYASLDGLLSDKATASLIAVPSGLSGSLTIPAGITRIGDSAFSECRFITSVTIPVGVTSIGAAAFVLCNALTSVTIPAGVTTIGESAFAICSRLTSVTIPASVSSIGGGAFYACLSLASIVFQGDPPALGGPLAGDGEIVATIAVYPVGNAAWAALGGTFGGLTTRPDDGPAIGGLMAPASSA